MIAQTGGFVNRVRNTRTILCVSEERDMIQREKKNTVRVGYEYGVILYTLSRLLPPADLPAYRDLLDELIDDRVTGAVWTEYYRNGRPYAASCPYRPWESAINLCGILAYLNAVK